ncbi:MAG: rubrerythrin family protein [Acidobacteria bacterium 21-70-11]|nr:MAG: rubrerythrin family protein [Acidobacteria bacterium 21-70-11]HQT93627.1 VIT1/CCC1 transporter family protein [Thermoanaerobaculaceae bacterium]HQU34299.1 VIT1/CCC1 transporter family protein [Thermoanaerobaculaceae bacterium]
MAPRTDVARFRMNRQEEIDSAAIYAAIAKIEANEKLAEVYRRLAASEEAHVAFWEGKLRDAGAHVLARRPSVRSRVIVWLSRRFGTQSVIPMLAMKEQAGRSDYDGQPDALAANLPAVENSHARLLSTISHARGSGMEGGLLARLEGRHRAVGGNALRAAVLGANDGLVSVLSLVMGVAGAHSSNKAILVAGLAGTLAGACAMAMGEWLSVQSARELAQRQIAIERDELTEAPEEEQEELSLIYQAKGLGREEADVLAAKLMADKDNVLDTLTREELGLDPAELGGSAWEAAITSFFLFFCGAIAPVAPFLFLSGATAVVTSLAASGLALFATGAVITLMTGRGVLFSGTRQLLIGMAAAGVTFGIGRLIGISVG